MSASSSSKKTLGRQKIEMVKIEDEASLLASFSKRKGGLFKKANELSTLCGVELAVVVKSPGNKIFSFGNPGAEQVIDRCLGEREAQETSQVSQLIEARRNATVQELGMQITEVRKQLAAEKKRGEELDQLMKESQEQNWFKGPRDAFDVSQLQQLRSAMRELQMKVEMQYFQTENLPGENTNPRQCFVGSSSSQGPNPNHETMTNDGMPLFDANMMMGGGHKERVPNLIPTLPGSEQYMMAPAPEYNPVMDEGYHNMIAPPLPPLPPSLPPGPPLSPLPPLPETWDEGYDIAPTMTTPPPQGYIGDDGHNIVPTPPSEGYNAAGLPRFF